MQIIKPIFLTLALALGGCIPAAQADDPAITVCEEIIKLGLVAPKTYERVTASVDGLLVHVSYDAMNPAGVPLRNAKSCVFAQRNDGLFGLSPAWVSAGVNERLDELRDMKVKAAGLPTYDERFSTMNAIDAEAAQISKTMRENLALHMDYEMIATGLNIYPIQPASTNLNSADINTK